MIGFFGGLWLNSKANVAELAIKVFLSKDHNSLQWSIPTQNKNKYFPIFAIIRLNSASLRNQQQAKFRRASAEKCRSTLYAMN